MNTSVSEGETAHVERGMICTPQPLKTYEPLQERLLVLLAVGRALQQVLPLGPLLVVSEEQSLVEL